MGRAIEQERKGLAWKLSLLGMYVSTKPTGSALSAFGCRPQIRQGWASRSPRCSGDTDCLCASVLREQIAMLEAWLAPGSDWAHLMAEAEQRLEELRTQRKQAESSLAALRDALERVERQERWQSGITFPENKL